MFDRTNTKILSSSLILEFVNILQLPLPDKADSVTKDLFGRKNFYINGMLPQVISSLIWNMLIHTHILILVKPEFIFLNCFVTQ